MHIKAAKEHIPAAQVGRQDLTLPTGTDRSIETYFELLRSGQPLSEVLKQAIGNSDQGHATQSDVAARSDFEDQEANTGHELRGHIQVLLEGAAERLESSSTKFAAQARSERLGSTGAVATPPPSACGPAKRWSALNRRPFVGPAIGAIGAIGIFLYPPLTDTPTSDQGAPQNIGERQTADRLREEPSAIDRLADAPAEATSNIALAQPVSIVEATFGSATVGTTVTATRVGSCALPSAPTSTVDAVSPGATTESAATVEVTSHPPISSTPAIEAKIDRVPATIASDVPAITRHRVNAEEIAVLLSLGDTLMERADVASARLFYQRAADAGDAQAALRLGETYDTSFLVLARLNGVRGDAAMAARWYCRARDLGSPEAEDLLNSVHTN